MNRKTTSPSKGQVEKSLGKKIPACIWKYVVKKRMIGDAAEAEDPVEFLASEICDLLALRIEKHEQPYTPTRKQRRIQNLPLRRRALSAVLAAHADSRSSVRNFRERLLGDRLLTWDEVVPWIKARANDCEHRTALIASLPKECKLDHTNDLQVALSKSNRRLLRVERVFSPESISFSHPDSEFNMSLAIGWDGPLRELYALSEELVRTYGWKPAQATVFVLTGGVPQLAGVKHCVTGTKFIAGLPGGREQVNALARITLTLDPLLSAREVATIYGEERRKILKSKVRQLSVRQLHMAEFCAGKEITLDLLASWNRTFSKWSYFSRFSQFGRDARVAQVRLIRTRGLDPLAS